MSNKTVIIQINELPTVEEAEEQIKELIADYKSEIEIDDVDEWLLPITKKGL